MAIESTDFMDALRWLGAAELPKVDPSARVKAIARDELDNDTKIDAAAHVWRSAVDLRGTPAERYLASRGITQWPQTSRFANTWACCDWETGETGPNRRALIGCVEDGTGSVAVLQLHSVDGGRELREQGREERVPVPD